MILPATVDAPEAVGDLKVGHVVPAAAIRRVGRRRGVGGGRAMGKGETGKGERVRVKAERVRGEEEVERFGGPRGMEEKGW